MPYRLLPDDLADATARDGVMEPSTPYAGDCPATGKSWRTGCRLLIALGAMAFVLAPGLAIGCAVTTPMPREALDAAASVEADAWFNSELVWVAVVTDVIESAGGVEDRFRLTPVLVLQGADPPELVLPADRRVIPACRYYRGLDRSGAEAGSEFIIYARSARPNASNVLVVSTAQVSHPLSRLAIDSARAEAFRVRRGEGANGPAAGSSAGL